MFGGRAFGHVAENLGKCRDDLGKCRDDWEMVLYFLPNSVNQSGHRFGRGLDTIHNFFPPLPSSSDLNFRTSDFSRRSWSCATWAARPVARWPGCPLTTPAARCRPGAFVEAVLVAWRQGPRHRTTECNEGVGRMSSSLLTNEFH